VLYRAKHVNDWELRPNHGNSTTLFAACSETAFSRRVRPRFVDPEPSANRRQKRIPQNELAPGHYSSPERNVAFMDDMIIKVLLASVPAFLGVPTWCTFPPEKRLFLSQVLDEVSMALRLCMVLSVTAPRQRPCAGNMRSCRPSDRKSAARQ